MKKRTGCKGGEMKLRANQRRKAKNNAREKKFKVRKKENINTQ